jgi:hypothetical protein
MHEGVHRNLGPLPRRPMSMYILLPHQASLVHHQEYLTSTRQSGRCSFLLVQVDFARIAIWATPTGAARQPQSHRQTTTSHHLQNCLSRNSALIFTACIAGRCCQKRASLPITVANVDTTYQAVAPAGRALLYMQVILTTLASPSALTAYPARV